MKKIIYFIFFSFFLLKANEYNQIYMRDLAILMDDTENPYSFLSTSLKNDITNYRGSTASLDAVSEILYHEACPLIISQTLLHFFFSLYEKTELIIKNSKDISKLSELLKTDSDYTHTILQDAPDYLTYLTHALIHLNENYETLKKTVNEKLPFSSIKEINNEIKDYYLNTNISDSIPLVVQQVAGTMFKYFLVVRKIKESAHELTAFKINDYIALVIPLNYVNKLKKQAFLTFNSQNIDTNNTELLLGFAYKSLSQINNPYSSSEYRHQTRFGALKLREETRSYLESNFISTLSSLKTFTFSSTKMVEKYIWNIYILGHGGIIYEPKTLKPQVFISSMPESVFLELLKLFNTQLNANLVFVASCSSGSPPRLASFNQLPINYTLAIGNSLDGPSSRYIQYNFVINDKKSLEISYMSNIANFFDSLRMNEQNSYINIMNDIQHFWRLNELGKISFKIQNIPLIRFPDTSWFKLPDSESIFHINTATIKDTTRPLIISDKQLIFISELSGYDATKDEYYGNKYSNIFDIVPSIKIQGKIMPKLLIQGPYRSTYNFTTLEADTLPFTRVLFNLVGYYRHAGERVLNIQKLIVRNPFVQKDLSDTSDLDFLKILFKKSSHLMEPLKKKFLSLKDVTIKIDTIDQNKFQYIIRFTYKDQRYELDTIDYAQLSKQLLFANNYPSLIPIIISYVPKITKDLSKKNKFQLDSLSCLRLLSTTLTQLQRIKMYK